MDMILVYFHFDYSEMVSTCYVKCELFYVISEWYQSLFSIVADKNQVAHEQKLGMVFGMVIHDFRALTLCILENLGIGFKSALVP